MFKKYVIAMLCALSLAASTGAQEEKTDKMTAEQFEASLNYRQGEIALTHDAATLKIPSNFRYLGPEDAEKVLVQAQGKPGENQTLGVLFLNTHWSVIPSFWLHVMSVIFSFLTLCIAVFGLSQVQKFLSDQKNNIENVRQQIIK